jgi:hypothetical protein
VTTVKGEFVLAGHTNTNIGADHGKSQHTLENHRASCITNTQLRPLPYLVRLVMAAVSASPPGGTVVEKTSHDRAGGVTLSHETPLSGGGAWLATLHPERDDPLVIAGTLCGARVGLATSSYNHEARRPCHSTAFDGRRTACSWEQR